MACLVAPSAVDEAKGLAARGCVVEAAASLLASSGCDGGATDASGLLSTLLARCRAEPYACLGLAKPTDDASVKAAYRERALAYHPDKNDYDSTALFQSLGEANDKLKTATARKDWEAERREAREAKRGDAAAPAKEPSPPKPDDEKTQWKAMVASTIDGFVAEDAGRRRAVENADRAERHRRASNAAATKRRVDADLAAQKKNRDSHRAWLRGQREAREKSFSLAADKYRALGGGRPPAKASPRDDAKASPRDGAKASPATTPRTRGGRGLSSSSSSRPLRAPLGLTLERQVAPDGDEQTVVLACVDDGGGPGAAERLGVRPGDVLVAVNDADTRGYSFKKATAMIGGAPWPRVLKFQRRRKRAPTAARAADDV
ncbi:tRNA-Phe hydroxylase [Aureococcus anophagefferens]|nr:tRNA-Phe hydroxylase [Aureococcus anophagefferens]